MDRELAVTTNLIATKKTEVAVLRLMDKRTKGRSPHNTKNITHFIKLKPILLRF
jgi:hypothetical protein